MFKQHPERIPQPKVRPRVAQVVVVPEFVGEQVDNLQPGNPPHVLNSAASSHNGTTRGESCGKSSILLVRMIGSIFMRVNSKCAHQERPPLKPRFID